MNKMKRKRIRTTLMAVCLMVAMLASQLGQVMTYAAGEVTTTVSTLPALLTAIESAQDGDVIGIMYGLNVSADAVIGDPDKQITLKRMSDTSYLDVKLGNILFQNVIFDGGGITSLYPMVMINNNVTFENVVFRNSITNTAGGAVAAYVGEATFRNCLFENNRAIAGGHIVVRDSASVIIENSILKNGQAIANGGAIRNVSGTSNTTITSSIITGNSAGDYGGGLANGGNMKITETKVYNNTATNGGADIGNLTFGNLTLTDSLETLIELFKDDGIIPKGWINDYDFEAGIYIPDIDPTVPNSLLKLDYEILPTEVTLAPSSLGSAGDGKITGLESGKYFKVTVDDVIYYAKADGSLTATESEASPLIGTEIIGLTNGETYLVEEFTPAPTSVLLDAASLGTADNEKIIGLESGKKYKITVDSVINYAKSDGSLTITESEAEALTGSEIVGLTNGVTYLVEVYTAPVVPDPDPVVEEPTPTPNPTEEPSPTPTETPTPSVDPTPTPTPEPTPTPTPTPVVSNPSSGGSSHSNHSSTTVVTVTQPETKTPIVLASGKAVMDTTKTEYLLGYTDALMGNKGTVTRAQLAQIVYKLLTTESKAAVYSKKNSFKDVSSNAWYNEAVSTIESAGLISKGSDGKFNPDQNITWGEMVTILAKFAEPNSEWKIITKHWAKDSINTAISYRWIDYNDQFNPDGEVTSVEMLNFINAMITWTKQ